MAIPCDPQQVPAPAPLPARATVPISARKSSLDDTLEERMDSVWEAFRMQIPLFESLKSDVSKLQRERVRLKIRMSQLDDA
jgi:hypothetical protein